MPTNPHHKKPNEITNQFSFFLTIYNPPPLILLTPLPPKPPKLSKTNPNKMLELSESHTKNFHFHLTHIILFFTCFSLIFNLSKAQSSMEPVPTYITHHSWEPSVAITVGAIIIALLLMGIISIYLRRCAESHIIITTTQTTTTTLPCSCAQGINRELLNTFPTLFYSNIKDLKKGNETLECAVCLTDFTDKDALRLLPKCNHVFHPHCIDSWLACHVTCPVCRANLSQESCHVSITVPPHNEEEGSGNTTPITTTNETTQIEQSPTNDVGQVCVDPTPTSDTAKIVYISEEQQQQHSSSELAFGVELGPNTNSTTNNGGDGVVVVSERNLSRSNSTGHCLVEEQGKCVERYTLRLPEDVRRYILVNHGRSVQRSASVKGVCWSDSEESYKGKRVNGEVRVEKRWVICTPPFVGHV